MVPKPPQYVANSNVDSEKASDIFVGGSVALDKSITASEHQLGIIQANVRHHHPPPPPPQRHPQGRKATCFIVLHWN